ncbi:MAG TPA: MBL fold metallo-hydrolase [Natronosporangium sp.]|nr:MBL fold metallo-hydrolase [Natronosporangium sp.]
MIDEIGRVTFIGTATTLLRLGEFTLLTDPNFLHRGQRAYLGYGLSSRRLTNPAARIEDLPPLDAVLLSHLHGDHFDRVARRKLARYVPIITTPPAERRLQRWGFQGADGLATWESRELARGRQRLRITAVPGQHGPTGVQRLLPPVMGSVLDLEQDGQRRLRLYLTGDTLYRPALAQIPQRFPDIDVMLLHLGGTRILGVLLSMDARQGLDLVQMIRPQLAVPIHYDDYRVFRSPLRHFLAGAERWGLRGVIRPIARGQTITLPARSLAGSG